MALRHHLRRPAAARPAPTRTTVSGHRLVVGFADLCGYSEVAETIDWPQLADLLDRFERLTTDAVRHTHGHVVKHVGDQVMFVHLDASDAVAAVRRMLVAVASDDVLPPLRAGLAAGPALVRRRDLFGPVVNRASRLCSAAAAQSLLVDAAVQRELDPDRCTSVGALALKGLGSTPAWTAGTA